jgi:hypothetical protein
METLRNFPPADPVPISGLARADWRNYCLHSSC